MRRAGQIGLLLVLYGFAGFWPAPAQAHDPRPLTIDIRQKDQKVSVDWKTPGSVAPADRPVVTLEPSCQLQGRAIERRLSNAYGGYAAFICPLNETTAHDTVLSIRYPQGNPSLASFIRLHDAAGLLQHSEMLKPGITDWSFPAASPEGRGNEISAPLYFRLGVVHILKGWDHLLFLTCLMMIAGGTRRLILAVTGFTLSHSLTLGAATLDMLSMPIVLVEALIALSIVFLAAEILRADRTTLTWRHPVSVAFLFGLLHGFGFANVLTHLGLPTGQVVPALLFFNLGVEAGQLVFVLAIGAVLFTLRLTLRRQFAGRLTAIGLAQHAAIWPVGLLAGFWSVQRVLAFWG